MKQIFLPKLNSRRSREFGELLHPVLSIPTVTGWCELEVEQQLVLIVSVLDGGGDAAAVKRRAIFHRSGS